MASENTGAPVHLRPHADVAERVLLPGDPGRALRLAQVLLAPPAPMLNHNRGLWGYSGIAADGALLTIQSSGMGGPSAAIVVEELIRLGARRIVRIGTCCALDASLPLGTLLAADSVIARDGVSRALGAGDRLTPDPVMTALLSAHAGATGPVLSSDLFYSADGAEVAREGEPGGAVRGATEVAPEGEPGSALRGASAGALARDLESAAVLAVATARGATAACVLAVVEDAAGARLDIDAVHAVELELASAGAAALGV